MTFIVISLLLSFPNIVIQNVSALSDTHIVIAGGIGALSYTSSEHVVTNGSDYAVACIGRNGDATYINFLYSDDSGATWTEAAIRTTINATPVVSIARDLDFNIHCVYIEKTMGAFHGLYYKKFDWATKTWDAPANAIGYNLTVATYYASIHIDLKVDTNNNVIVINPQHNHGTINRLYSFRYNNGLGTWDISIVIDSEVTAYQVYQFQSLALDSSLNLYLTYSKKQNGLYASSFFFDTWFTNSSDTGATWAAPVQVVNKTYPTTTIANKLINDNSDILHFTYTANYTGSNNFVNTYATSIDSGLSFSHTNYTDNTVNSGVTCVTIDSNNVLYFTYSQSTVPGAQLDIKGKKYESGSFGAEIDITTGAGDQTYLNLVFSNTYNQYATSGIIGVYEDRNVVNYDIRLLKMLEEDFFFSRISNENPTDASVITDTQPLCYATVIEENNNPMTVFFRENSTGTWLTRQIYNNVGSGATPSFLYAQANTLGNFWWSINVTNGYSWTNATYNFTIIAPPGNVVIRCFDEGDLSPLAGYDYIIIASGIGTIETGFGSPVVVDIDTTGWPVAPVYEFTLKLTGYFTSYMSYSYAELFGVADFAVDAYLIPIPSSWSASDYTNVTWYEFQVVNRFQTPIENARLELRHVNNTNASNVTVIGISYTDNNGEVQFPYLVAYDTYYVNLSAECYIDRVETYIPGPLDLYKTFMMDYNQSCVDDSAVVTDIISVDFAINVNNIFINISDLVNQSENTHIHVYEINNITGEMVLLVSFYYIYNASITAQQPINSSSSHKIVVNINHTMFGFLQYSHMFQGIYSPIITPDEFDDIITRILKWNPFGWSNFFMFMFIVVGFFSADRANLGGTLMFVGGMFLFFNFVIGFNNLMVTYAGGIVPPLVILSGFLIAWDDSRKGGMR